MRDIVPLGSRDIHKRSEVLRTQMFPSLSMLTKEAGLYDIFSKSPVLSWIVAGERSVRFMMSIPPSLTAHSLPNLSSTTFLTKELFICLVGELGVNETNS